MPKLISPKFRSVALYILTLFIISRVLLLGAGIAARGFIGTWQPNNSNGVINESRKTQGFSKVTALDIWGEWDSGWYLNIAKNGYAAAKDGTQANYAFLPLFPYASRLLGSVAGGPFVAGLIISNLSLILSAFLIYKLIALDGDHDKALRGVRYLFLYPTAFMLSAFLSDSLFLMLLLAAFYFARTGKWGLTGMAGFFLSFTRLLGVLAVIPLFWIYFKQRGFSLAKIRSNVLSFLLFPAGFSIYLWLNYRLTGHPLAFLKNALAPGWDRALSNPLIHLISKGDYLPPNAIAGTFALIAILGFIIYRTKMRTEYLLLAAYSILIPISSALLGMPRYIMTLFPIYILAADIFEQRELDNFAMIALALVQGIFMVFWSGGFPIFY